MGLDSFDIAPDNNGGGEVRDKPDHVDLPDDKEWEDMTSVQRWYYENHEEAKKTIREGVKQHRKDRLEWLKKQKKEHWECEECGEDNPAVLQFHHTDDNRTGYNIRRLVSSRSMDFIEEEIKRANILCANCHLKLHYDESDGYVSKDKL